MKKSIGIIFLLLAVHFTGHAGQWWKRVQSAARTKARPVTKIKPRRIFQSTRKVQTKSIPLAAKTKTRIATMSLAGAAVTTPTLWDKIWEFLGGYGHDYTTITSSIDEPDVKVGPVTYEYNPVDAYNPKRGIIPYYPKSLENIERDLRWTKIYNISKAKNGFTYEFRMGNAKTETMFIDEQQQYIPAVATLMDRNNKPIARYVFKSYTTSNINPQAKQLTSELIASSLVENDPQNNPGEHLALLKYAEAELKKYDIRSITNKTVRSETDVLWEQFGYEGATKVLK